MSAGFVLPNSDELYAHDWNQRTGSDNAAQNARSTIETHGLEHGRKVEWTELAS